MKQLSFFIKLLVSCIFCSCSTYYYPVSQFQHTNCPEYQNEASSHCLYNFIPRHRCQIKWFDIGHVTTWMFFGNDDNGIFGEAQSTCYHPDQPVSLKKAVHWWCRNPCHNFCFYVIGSAERSNSEIDILKVNSKKLTLFDYHPIGTTTFAGESSSFYLALHGGKPFISFRVQYLPTRRFDFYFGWRERGNFGIKFLPFAKKNHYRVP